MCLICIARSLIERSPFEALCRDDTAKNFEAMLRARDLETKQLVSLATRMRLTNQSRYTAAAAGSILLKTITGQGRALGIFDASEAVVVTIKVVEISDYFACYSKGTKNFLLTGESGKFNYRSIVSHVMF